MSKKSDDWLYILAALIVLAALWWMMRRKAQGANPTPASVEQALPQPGAAQYWGPNGQPFAQGGNMDNPIFNQITIPVPSYGYAGNSQIYMPLFGFVGYSQLGTVG